MRYFMPASILISQAQSLSLLPSVPLAPPPPHPPTFSITCHSVLKFCATVALSLCVVGIAYGQTPDQTPAPPVCDRTDEVSHAIVSAIPGVSQCQDVTVADMAEITGSFTLSSLPNGLKAGDFNGLTGLTELDMDNANLMTLPAGIFDDLLSLEALDLRRNRLTTLPAGIFDGLVGLEDLNLGSNQLTTLPAGIFDDLVNVNDLGLVNNQLTTLPTNLFINNRKLAQLHLTENDLETLPDNLFAGLENLTNLNLNLRPDDNPFSEGLPAGIFDALPFMFPISLHLTAMIGELPSEVLVDNNEEAVLNLAEAFRRTKITVPRYLFTAASYEVLVDDPTIASTSLSNTHTLTIDPQVNSGQTMVTAVGIAGAHKATQTFTVTVGTGLTAVPTGRAVCSRTAEVQAVILAATGTADCNDVDLEHLQTTDAHFEFYAQLPDGLDSIDFRDLPSVPVLDIGGNDLSNLPPDLLDDMTGLEHFSVPHSQLNSLRSGLFSNNSHLQSVSLFSNKLEALPSNLFAGLSDLRALFLHDNPLGEGLPADTFDSLTLDNLTLDLTAVIDALPPVTLTDPSMTIDLRSAFMRSANDGTADILRASSYEIMLESEEVIRVLPVDNHELTIMSIANGQTTVTVLGIHGSGKATQTMTVAVEGVSPAVPSVCDRTSAVNAAIVAELTVADCNSVTGGHLSGITEIDLRNESISTLRSTDFNGLSAVTRLRLDNNSLTVLPLGIFDEMDSLAELNLSGNDIDRLPFGIFDSLELTAFTIDGTAAMDGALPSAITLTDENPSTTLDLRPAFVRGDGGAILPADPSDYSISVVDEDVAQVSREGHKTTVTGINVGMTEVVISVGSDTNKGHRITIDSQRMSAIIVNPTSVSVREGETVNITVSAEGGRTATLDAAYGAELSGPAQVEAPAGGDVTWTITAADPAGYQGDRESTVALSAPGYISTSVTVRLLENDADGLTIALESSRLIELGSQVDIGVTITRERGNREVNVTATSDDTGVVTVDAASETMLSLSAVNLGLANVTLTATGEGYDTATATLNVEVTEQLPDVQDKLLFRIKVFLEGAQ